MLVSIPIEVREGGLINEGRKHTENGLRTGRRCRGQQQSELDRNRVRDPRIDPNLNGRNNLHPRKLTC